MRPLYRAVMGMYVHPRFVRRAVCPRCGAASAPENVGELHRHNHRSVVLVARMVRILLYLVEPDGVESALTWLDNHWRGQPYVPDELLPLVAVA